MAPLSVVPRMAAGSRQNKEEMRLVVQPLTCQWLTYMSQTPFFTPTDYQSLPFLYPSPVGPSEGYMAFFPHSSSPLLHSLWFSVLRFLLRAGKKGRRTSRSRLDMFHMWMIYCMCVKTFFLIQSRGLSHKSWWVELKRFSITHSSEAPQHSDPEINPAFPIDASRVQSLSATAQPINRYCAFARSHFSQVPFI